MISTKCFKPLLLSSYQSVTVVETVFRQSNQPLVAGWRGSGIHTTACFQFPGQEWRKKHGKPANLNAYGPLTDGPDYSFLDGRPTPIGTGKVRRAKEQKEITSKIIKYTSEVDFAVANHAARTQKEKDRRAKIIQDKLKPKGRIPPEVL